MRSAARTSTFRRGAPDLHQGFLALAHLTLGALEHDVVTPGHDLDIEVRFERAKMVVVPPQQMAQVDVRGERNPARDRGGFAQLLSFPLRV
jgi:hypothetical protein